MMALKFRFIRICLPLCSSIEGNCVPCLTSCGIGALYIAGNSAFWQQLLDAQLSCKGWQTCSPFVTPWAFQHWPTPSLLDWYSSFLQPQPWIPTQPDSTPHSQQHRPRHLRSPSASSVRDLNRVPLDHSPKHSTSASQRQMLH